MATPSTSVFECALVFCADSPRGQQLASNAWRLHVLLGAARRIRLPCRGPEARWGHGACSGSTRVASRISVRHDAQRGMCIPGGASYIGRCSPDSRLVPPGARDRRRNSEGSKASDRCRTALGYPLPDGRPMPPRSKVNRPARTYGAAMLRDGASGSCGRLGAPGSSPRYE